MGPLLRMAGLRDLRRDDGLSDVSATVLGDRMSGLTLEYQLKQLNERHMEYSAGLQAKIDQLEQELAAEKALTHLLMKRTRHAVQCDKTSPMTFSSKCTCGLDDDLSAYRKARGLQ